MKVFTIHYPPDNDGVLFINVEEFPVAKRAWSEYTFKFKIAGNPEESDWEALVRAAKGILNQDARRNDAKEPFSREGL